jgi:hypothetical protein
VSRRALSWRDRLTLFTGGWTGPLLLVLLLGIGAIVFLVGRHPGATPDGIDCIQQYQHARTAADSAIVDARAARNRGKAADRSITCGMLRRSEQLTR